MTSYDLISQEEKRNIIVGRVRSLEIASFSLELEILEESALSNKDNKMLQDLTNRLLDVSNKIIALKSELEKYPQPEISPQLDQPADPVM